MTLKIVMNQAASPADRERLICSAPQRCCCRFNQNSLIVQCFSPERVFVG